MCHTDNGFPLQITTGAYSGLPGPTGDGRALQRTTGRTRLTKDCRARPSTTWTAVFLRFGRFALASLPTLPGTDGTIGRQGPGVRTGRLGTLVISPLERIRERCRNSHRSVNMSVRNVRCGAEVGESGVRCGEGKWG